MSTVSVSEIVTKNYKNLRLEDGISLGGLTVFIGSNGSGKSNVISLLQFLQGCLAGSGTDDQRGQTNFEDAVIGLGGARILDGTLNAPARIGIEYTFPITEHKTIFSVELLVQSSLRQVTITSEHLGSDQGKPKPFLYYSAHNERRGGSGNGVVSIYDKLPSSNVAARSRKTHFERIQNLPVNEFAMLALPRLLENSENPPESTPLYEIRGKLMDSVAAWKFYHANDMNLEWIRFSTPKRGRSDYFILPSGRNLSVVLHNLIQEDFEFEDTLNRVFKDICR